MMQGIANISQPNEQQVNSVSSNDCPKFTPVGLNDLLIHCSNKLYNVDEPIAVGNNKSLILGTGSDPLDWIYIYRNKGDLKDDIPPHWHYVSFGLSDIYGYAVLYEILMQHQTTTEPPPQHYPLRNTKHSGYGIELTIRLKCESDDGLNEQPPEWPIRMLQDLAKYIFQSKNKIEVGDNCAWCRSLDGEGESRIRHMLMTEDPQLQEAQTSLGSVKFIQIVGACEDELQAARKYKAEAVLELMKAHSETGGQLLITDMRRGLTVFEIDPSYHDTITDGFSKYGSNMVCINVNHEYSSRKSKRFEEVEKLTRDDDDDLNEQEYDCLMPDYTTQGVERGSLLARYKDDAQTARNQDNHANENRAPSSMSYQSESELYIDRLENQERRFYESLYLVLTFETVKQFLPVALRGRLPHGKPFHIKTLKGDLQTSFIPQGYPEEQCLVTEAIPFTKQGPWLQIYVYDDLRKQMLKSIEDILAKDSHESINLSYQEYKLYITVVDKI